MKRILLVLLGWLFAVPALALTFVQMPDHALLDQAELVVEAEILDTVPLGRQLGDTTIYRVRVSDVLKGLSSQKIEVFVPGGATLQVPGAPQFDASDEVLLFLTPRSDGSYAITQSTLGVFYKEGVSQAVARRQLAGTIELPGTGLGVLLPAADQLRDWEGFKHWLRMTAAGAETAPSYWNAVTEDDRPTTANFRTLGTPPSRWFEFDSDQSITQRAHSSGQTGLTGGGYGEFQAGIAAWNSDTGSNIRYVYGGTTTASGGLLTGDGVNTILFNDPNNEVEGSFSCTSGGVLASGGFRTSGTGSFNGTVFNRISESDIVIQNNAGCFLEGENRTNAREIFAHELGHTLGLGHACGDSGLGPLSDCSLNPSADDSLMRAFPHADGRGADLRADDEAGAEFLYDASTSGGGTPPPSGGGSTAVEDDGGGGGGKLDSALLFLLMLFVLFRHGQAARTSRSIIRG